MNVHIIRPAKRYVEWVEEQLLDGEHLWTGEEYDAEALGSIHRVLLPALELACDLMVRARGLHCLFALICKLTVHTYVAGGQQRRAARTRPAWGHPTYDHEVQAAP